MDGLLHADAFDQHSREKLARLGFSEALLLNQARNVAEMAGQTIVTEVRRLGLRAVVDTRMEKSDGSPVSTIDLMAHEVVQKGLQSISDFPLVSEEDPSGPLSLEKIREGEFFWLADPLDGTRDFLAGEKTFAVALSLMRKVNRQDAPSLGSARGFWGAVVDPSESRTWAASRFQSLAKWVNGVPSLFSARPSQRKSGENDCESRDELRILGSRSIPNDRLDQLYQFWGSRDVTRMGSAMKFALIAEGLYDVYPRFGPTSEWDTAAGQILLESVGGGLFSLATGAAMTYGKKGWVNGGFLAASTSTLLTEWTPRMRLHQV